MGTVRITREGKDLLIGMPSLKRRILMILLEHPFKLLDLMKKLQKEYIEYRYMKERIVMQAIADLIKIHCVKYL